MRRKMMIWGDQWPSSGTGDYNALHHQLTDWDHFRQIEIIWNNSLHNLPGSNRSASSHRFSVRHIVSQTYRQTELQTAEMTVSGQCQTGEAGGMVGLCVRWDVGNEAVIGDETEVCRIKLNWLLDRPEKTQTLIIRGLSGVLNLQKIFDRICRSISWRATKLDSYQTQKIPKYPKIT